jgi:hypothetical protein
VTIGIAKPFESLRAVLVIEDAEEDSGPFGPQIKVSLRVASDGKDGEYDGAIFTDWLSLDETTGNVKPRSKAWQVIEAVLGEVPTGLEAEDLVGGSFAAQVKHDTISPAPRKKAGKPESEKAVAVDESEFDDIPF